MTSLPNERPTRILIVDDDENARQQLMKIFMLLGYETSAATGVGDLLARNALQLACEQRPHVAIVDMRLNDDLSTTNTQGIELLVSLASAAGILYSAHMQLEDLRRLYDAGGFNWVHKRQRANILTRAVEEAAAKRSARHAGVEIEWQYLAAEQELVGAILADVDDDGLRRTLPTGILNDIVWQLHAERGPERITLQPLHGASEGVHAASRSSSTVVLARSEGWAPSIIKFTQPEQMLAESHNYRAWIDGKLNGGFHTQLMGTTHFWDLGGAMYSLVGADGSLVTFSRHFSDPAVSPDALKMPLHHLFAEAFSIHYGKATVASDGGLLAFYDDVFGLRQKLEDMERVELLRGCRRVSAVDAVTFVTDELEDHCPSSYVVAPTHGDLHGDNLFVGAEHAWLIDFGRTGQGHALRDFIELEVDIITRLLMASPLQQEQLVQLSLALANPARLTDAITVPDEVWADPLAQKAVILIEYLRGLAQTLLPQAGMREYMVGMLCNCVYVALLKRIRPEQRSRSVCYATAIVEQFRRHAYTDAST